MKKIITFQRLNNCLSKVINCKSLHSKKRVFNLFKNFVMNNYEEVGYLILNEDIFFQHSLLKLRQQIDPFPDKSYNFILKEIENAKPKTF